MPILSAFVWPPYAGLNGAKRHRILGGNACPSLKVLRFGCGTSLAACYSEVLSRKPKRQSVSLCHAVWKMLVAVSHMYSCAVCPLLIHDSASILQLPPCPVPPTNKTLGCCPEGGVCVWGRKQCAARAPNVLPDWLMHVPGWTRC